MKNNAAALLCILTICYSCEAGNSKSEDYQGVYILNGRAIQECFSGLYTPDPDGFLGACIRIEEPTGELRLLDGEEVSIAVKMRSKNSYEISAQGKMCIATFDKFYSSVDKADRVSVDLHPGANPEQFTADGSLSKGTMESCLSTLEEGRKNFLYEKENQLESEPWEDSQP